MAKTFARAAQYVRMSTEHQRYSIASQIDGIARFAVARDYHVVKTYIDAGVTGLRLDGRDGLKQLLSDAVGGQADYSVVLVYDVSRWGRFQDPDQGAHYEFICREAGVQVEYCNEPFTNDGSLTATLVKHLKRAMAAEYSRELSVKVSSAQRRVACAGYWRGGSAGLGFRRAAVAPDGSLRPLMEVGQRKAFQGERTALVLGPAEEVALVRRVYRLFLRDDLGTREIAQVLNAEGATAGRRTPWTSSAVRNVLSNEKYAGTLVAGMRTSRLRRISLQPPETWLRIEGACPAIVSRATFARARARVRRRRLVHSDEQLLDELRDILKRRGRLSSGVIASEPAAHAVGVYINRFGGLAAAYERLGYEPTERQRVAAARMKLLRPHLARLPVPSLSDEELLDHARRVLAREGRITCEIIDAVLGGPSWATYRRRFGGVAQLHARLGVTMGSRRGRPPVLPTGH